MGALEERLRLAAPLLGRTGENYFPFTHPNYPYPIVLTRPSGERSSNPLLRDANGGLRIWWEAAMPTRWEDFRVMSPTKIPAFRKTNGQWLDETVPAFYRVGMVRDGEVQRRPSSPAIVDLMLDPKGWLLLEAAHALAHQSETNARFRPAGYGQYGALMLNWVAKLVTARRYDLPLDLSCEPPPSPADAAVSNDGFWRYGISVCDSSSFHAPVLRVPCLGQRAPRPHRDVAFVTVGVYIEPHPRGFADGSEKWLEVNRWSCMPTMLSFAGWECIDVISRQQPSIPVPTSCSPEYVMAAPSLMPENTLCEYIDAAKAERGEAVADNVRYWKVDDWLRSRECRDMIGRTPTLPCKECLRLNMRAEGAPGRPESQPPKEKPSRSNKYLTRDEREWLEWDDKIDSVLGVIEKAVVYYESRLYGNTDAKRRRRARNHLARLRAAALKKAASLSARIDREFRKGNPSRAAAMRAELEELKLRIRNGTLSNHEGEDKKD